MGGGAAEGTDGMDLFSFGETLLNQFFFTPLIRPFRSFPLTSGHGEPGERVRPHVEGAK